MNPFEISTAITEMLYDMSAFFTTFLTWSFTVPGTKIIVTAFGLYSGAGTVVILWIIIRAIVRAVVA